MPNTRISEITTRLRGAVSEWPARTRVFMPTTAMEPNSRVMMPPITGPGMVCSSAPSLATKARAMAVQAATNMMRGSKARVRVTAPVTSE